MRAAFRKAIDDEDLDGDEQVGDGGDGDVTAFSSSRSLPQSTVTSRRSLPRVFFLSQRRPVDSSLFSPNFYPSISWGDSPSN